MKSDLGDVRVASGIRGRGVFARRPFRCRQIVGRVTGEMIRDPHYSSCYCIELGAGFTLEPAAPFRFLNHSCEPNCELRSVEAGGRQPPQARLYALRAIGAGEELTIDYAWPASEAIRCHCGSGGCRGWIVDRGELRVLLRRGTAAAW